MPSGPVFISRLPVRGGLVRAVPLLGPVGAAPGPPAQDQPPPEAPPVLPPVVVTAPPPVAASSEVLIPGRDFELRPQGRPADVVRLIPGFVISQHQGGGKAEQYFLRGFDADRKSTRLNSSHLVIS